jgi:uncharacterized repeat protein (TIGR03803 family)
VFANFAIEEFEMTQNRIGDRFAVAMLIMAVAATAHVAPAQTFSVLHDFGSVSGDPSKPITQGIVAQGRDGNLYTTATSGGAYNHGAVFEITPSGALTTLHSFCAKTNCPDGEQPQSGLTLGTDGNFYGTTYYGGNSKYNYGTVFKVTPSGSLTVLHVFTNGDDGALPWAPPIEGMDGNFYGTTSQYENGGNGSVYKITASGTFTTLHHFHGADGAEPFVPLVLGTDSNFYGTTGGGGQYGIGTVFKITPSGTLTKLHTFRGTDGEYPDSGLIQGSDGNFYGTTYYGGKYGDGVVYGITPTGSFTLLHSMNGTNDSARPDVGLVQGTDGYLYGVNSGLSVGENGNIFKISPTKPYPYEVIHPFSGKGGANPQAPLLQHTNGILYGDTTSGGTGAVSPCTADACGVFYSLNLGLGPFVTLLPYSGEVGVTIEFLGQGFTGTSAVSFNGTAATFTFVSDTYLTAIVPIGATTGFVTVTTPGGALTSNKQFLVTPQILSFKPTSGLVGTQVTITGVSLTQTTQVTFGGVVATSFVVNSDSQVTATVPAGAQTGKIGITTAGGVATSSGVFTVTQ